VVLQIGFFATPVMYPLSVFPQNLQQLLSYNPLAQIIYLARDVTLYAKAPNTASFTYVIIITSVILAVGYAIFSRLEPRFAEEL
jgi:lipopolysaccharide transport system permease protein